MEKLKYEADIKLVPNEYEWPDGTKEVYNEDEAHSWEESKEYSSMISNPCLFFDLYRTIFGKNHWAEKYAFKKSEGGCPEIDQHFFKHSIDDNHRLGSLRKLYKVLKTI